MASSCKLALALLLAVLAAAAPAASAAGGVPACWQLRKITVQNLCNHDLPLTVSPEVGSHELFGAGFVLRRGTHASFPVCSWAGIISAAGAPPTKLRIGGAAGAAWYSATFIQLEPVTVTVSPHADPASAGGGRLLGHCPVVGCGAGHGRCARETAAGSDCRNVDELKIIYFDHKQ